MCEIEFSSDVERQFAYKHNVAGKSELRIDADQTASGGHTHKP